MKVQRIEKGLRKDPHLNEFVPFMVTVRKSKIDKSNEAQIELKKKMEESVTYVEMFMAPPMRIPLKWVHDRIRKDQVCLMFAP